MDKRATSVAIVGGGIAGATAALLLGSMGMEVTLFEKSASLVNGPPFCHLHAGGNLYPEISDAQCLKLLEQSIDFARLYPFGVDHRPTIIALPSYCSRTTEHLLPRLEKLKAHYRDLMAADPANAVLGDPEDYYRLYSREEILALRQQPVVAVPSTPDEWMLPFVHGVDLSQLQFPVVLVQEYGLNLFRIGAGLMLRLAEDPHVELRLEHTVEHIQRAGEGWQITAASAAGILHGSYDYLINAAGFQTGRIDDMIGTACERMVEFKAAYVTQWTQPQMPLWPEIIFQGERGTPRGMGQFTPYPEGYFQLHGMTKEITLYEEGLVSNTPESCQPELPPPLLEKIEKAWSAEETRVRTQKAISHLARFIPEFASATVGSKPLFGAQQIPGSDPTLRVAEVAFTAARYARAEIVKVSSVVDMVEAIAADIAKLGGAERERLRLYAEYFVGISEARIAAQARRIALEREYPAALSQRCVSG